MINKVNQGRNNKVINGRYYNIIGSNLNYLETKKVFSMRYKKTAYTLFSLTNTIPL